MKTAEISETVTRAIELNRHKLLDLTRRNPLLSCRLNSATSGLVRFVDEVPAILKNKLCNQEQMELVSLPEIDSNPPDEASPRFTSALQKAKLSDAEYLEKIESLSKDLESTDQDLVDAERELRDRLRVQLGLPARPKDGKDSKSIIQHAQINGINTDFELPHLNSLTGDIHEKFSDERIQTLLLKEQLETKISNIVDKAKTWADESGLVVMHIAFGFMEWAERDQSTTSFAPLLLLPVELDRKKGSSGQRVFLKTTSDTLEQNEVLLVKLKELNIELPRFCDVNDLDDYISKCASLKMPSTRWKIHNQVALGIFPSARMAMYTDLGQPLAPNELINDLLGRIGIASPKPFDADYDNDDPSIEAKVPILVTDADTAQFSALVDLMQGKNLAVEGPPGTGKSQTIVNAIANYLFAGKKVLFVAEKKAALEVVRARLIAAGLGEFVLALQAERSNRAEIVKSVKERLDIRPEVTPKDIERKRSAYRDKRERLAEYIHLLARTVEPTGLTVQQILGRNIFSKDEFDKIPTEIRNVELPDISALTVDAIEKITAAAKELATRAELITDYDSVWREITLTNLTTFDIRIIQEHLDAAIGLLESADTLVRSISEHIPSGNPSENLLDRYHITLKFINDATSTSRALVTEIISAELHADWARYSDGIAAAAELYAVIRPLLSHEPSAETLNAVSSLARLLSDLGLSSADVAPLQQNLTSLSSRLARLESDFRLTSAFIEKHPSLRDSAFSQIQKAIEIVSETGVNVLQLRPVLPDSDVSASMLRRLVETANAIKARSRQLSDLGYTGSFDERETIQEAIQTLRQTSIVGRLFSEFRRAKYLYQRKFPGETFSLDLAIERLCQLRDILHEREDFSQLPEVVELFGPINKGVDEDFAQFEQLRTFYGNVARSLSTPADSELRRWLLTEQSDALSSATAPTLELWRNSHSALSTKLENLRSGIIECRGNIDSVRALVQPLLDPAVSHEALVALEKNLTHWIDATKQAEQIATVANISALRNLGYADKYELVKESMQLMLVATDRVNQLQFVCNASAPEISTVLNALAAARDNFQLANQHLTSIGGHCGITLHSAIEEKSIDEAVRVLKSARDSINDARLFSELREAQLKLQELGLGELVSKLAEDNEQLKKASVVIPSLMNNKLAHYCFRLGGQLLRMYRGHSLDALRKELADLDREIIRLSRQWLRAKLIDECDAPDGVSWGTKSEWSEMALITNEVQKKKRFLSFRELVQRAGCAIQEIKPVWMMSPLAVAQYIPKDMTELHFDLCVIDEASQMAPHDALGALLRSKQVMVVGDTNQLPPSNFWQAALDDKSSDDTDNDVEFLEESILAKANAVFSPPRRLTRHYRSRHEDLIRFSNNKIYDDSLIVMPSAQMPSARLGISLRLVKGHYRASVNMPEAEAMIDGIVDFMKHSFNRSLGVVVLNLPQRELLVKLLEDRASSEPVVSRYRERWLVDRDGLEYFFIKNLETVQGDERDVIFVGTVYGAEEGSTTVHRRFGPITGPAGVRRLNVLFSRAKEQIVTYSSMTAQDIRVEGLRNEGPKLLRDWLSFSQTGVLEGGQSSSREPDSDFERFVIAQIEAMGCKAEPQVGVKHYFIDIGVKHPDWPHGYVLGVECDGATFHSSKSARERDRIREDHLRGLGWKLHRIWSTDWFNDREQQVERLRRTIMDRLAELKSSYREIISPTNDDPAETTEIDPTPEQIALPTTTQAGSLGVNADIVEVGDIVEIFFLDSGKEMRYRISAQEDNIQNGILHISKPLAKGLIDSSLGDELELPLGGGLRKLVIRSIVKRGSVSARNSSGDTANPPGSLAVKPQEGTLGSLADQGLLLEKLRSTASSARFYDGSYNPKLREICKDLIEALAPITEEHLARLVARIHGFQRTGGTIQDRVKSAIRSDYKKVSHADSVTIWSQNQIISKFISYRGKKIADIERSWTDIPQEERLGLAVSVVCDNRSVDKVETLAERAGFSRLRAETRQELESLVRAAQNV